MRTLPLLLLFAVSALAQPDCNLKLKDAPSLRDGLRLGMNFNDASKSFAIKQDPEQSTNQVKVGKIVYDDVIFDVYFHNDELSLLYANYLEMTDLDVGQFSGVIYKKFKIPGGFSFAFDPIVRELGFRTDCADFAISALPNGRLALINTLLFDRLRKEQLAAEAAQIEKKTKTFKP